MVITDAQLNSMDVPELGELTRKAARALAARQSAEVLLQLTACLADLGRAMADVPSSGWGVGSAWAWPSSDHGVPAHPTRQQKALTLHAITEDQPGSQWQTLFETVWPAYRAWYLSEGESARPDLGICRRMLQRHMPELLPTWHRLIELTGGDELAARMLSQWDPPRFLPGCSQAVVTEPAPVLLRNYDYSPDLFERIVYSSAFTGRRVLGTSDCLWGLLDGMNDAGLAVSLAFGGRPGSAPGFGIPLVLRYLLEVATCTRHAAELLRDLPVSMSYNLSMVDQAGRAVTAFVAPGQQPELTDATVATNHRGRTPEHPDHARRFRSVERQDVLIRALAEGVTADELGDRLLRPPLHSTDYENAFGTLYTAVYQPSAGVVEYLWPGDRWQRTFTSASENKIVLLPE